MTNTRMVQDLEIGNIFEWNGRRRIVFDRPEQNEDGTYVILNLLCEDKEYDRVDGTLGFPTNMKVEVEQ